MMHGTWEEYIALKTGLLVSNELDRFTSLTRIFHMPAVGAVWRSAICTLGEDNYKTGVGEGIGKAYYVGVSGHLNLSPTGLVDCNNQCRISGFGFWFFLLATIR